MKMKIKDESPEEIKIKIKTPSYCEKCGEETSGKLFGDEIYEYCENCNWTTND